MATTIVRLATTSANYIQLTAGETNALIRNVGGFPIRVAAAATVPAAAVTDYITVDSGESLAAGSLTQNLWGLLTPSTDVNPVTRVSVVEVMKG